MLNKIINTTKEYIDLMPKETRKKYGQFLQAKKQLSLWQIYLM